MTFVVTIRILATALPAIGVALTSLRLYYRYSRRHLGWDDAWAALNIICAIFLCAGAWTRSDTPAVGPFHHGTHVRIIGYYMLNVAFTCVLWTSRMSILFSIMRLIPYMMRMRYWAYIFAVLFGLMWATLIILKLAICETDTAWKKLPGVQCVLGPAVGGVELATDFIADIILVLMPIRLLWRISLSPSRRSLLTGIFSASMFTTIVSIVHGVYVFSSNRNAEGIWAHVLASTAMIVCNLAVLVTWFMRALGHKDDSEFSPSGRTPGHSSSQGTPKDLTTLRFNHHENPIVLHTLDKKDHGGTTRTMGSCNSTESLSPMAFSPGGSKTAKDDSPPPPA